MITQTPCPGCSHKPTLLDENSVLGNVIYTRNSRLCHFLVYNELVSFLKVEEQ